jgi:hypothetical protein
MLDSANCDSAIAMLTVPVKSKAVIALLGDKKQEKAGNPWRRRGSGGQGP